MGEVVIDLQNLSKSYGKQQVLCGLDMKVNYGEMVVIKGNSGSGKSTLLNILGLLEKNDSGTYLLDKIEINNLNGRRQNITRSKKLSFIFQNYCLMENIDVWDNVFLPFLYMKNVDFRETEERAKKYLEELNLTHVVNKKAKYLSGGEKQRVAIVRALLKDSDIVLADEPTGNLDPVNSKIIAATLKRITELGKAVIVVTHNDVFEDADRIYTLHEGKLI